jgi:hypothetical protein
MAHSDNGLFSALQRNKLSSHAKTWRNLKCVSLMERSQSEKDICILYNFNYSHSEKGKTMEA